MLTYQAICNAHWDNETFGEFNKNVKAIVFIGTPHQGAGSAKFLGNILTVTLNKRVYVNELRTDSQGLDQIADAFRGRARELSLKLVSYFESLETRMFGMNLGVSSLTLGV